MGFTPKTRSFFGFLNHKEFWWEAASQGDFSSGKFNATLDCFCSQPVGMLFDSMQGNPDVKATGNGTQWHAEKSWRRHSSKLPLYGRSQTSSNAAVTCAIIARNVLQFLHAIIAGFQTCWKMFMRLKCCSQWQRLVESRDVVLVLTYMWRNRVYCLLLIYVKS